MDVKTGKIIKAESAGLVQVQNHSAGVKDMQKLHLLIKGTQSAAKHYTICMAHQSGPRQLVAVDSSGGSEVSLLESEPKMWKQKKFSNPKARCKGSPAKIPGKKGLWGTDWANLGHKGFTKQKCKDACLEQPLCKFATFNEDNRHCTAFRSCDKGEQVDIHKKGSKKGKAKSFVVWEKNPVQAVPAPASPKCLLGTYWCGLFDDEGI